MFPPYAPASFFLHPSPKLWWLIRISSKLTKGTRHLQRCRCSLPPHTWGSYTTEFSPFCSLLQRPNLSPAPQLFGRCQFHLFTKRGALSCCTPEDAYSTHRPKTRQNSAHKKTLQLHGRLPLLIILQAEKQVFAGKNFP